MKGIRDKIYISSSVWCLIQCVAFMVGAVGAFILGFVIIDVICRLWLDIPVLLVLIWIYVFTFLKFKIEEEFSDCIDV